MVCCGRTRENYFKLEKTETAYKENGFYRVVRHWIKLPREVVDALFLETFVVRLNQSLSNLIAVSVPVHCSGIGLDGL